MSRIKNFMRNINYLTKHSLWDDSEEQIVYLTNKILDDSIYEFGNIVSGIKQLSILTPAQSIELIKNKPKSFIRTSDGEIKLMMGMDQPFQKYEKEIADTLLNILKRPMDNIYVGLNRNYFIPLSTRENSAYYRRNAYDFRRFYLNHCCAETTYIDATFTSYEFNKIGTDQYTRHFSEWKSMFKNRDLIIVCGQGILKDLKYDIFELASSKQFIEGPKRHAWSAHQELINKIKSMASTEQIIIFILGMAGKAMIPELADMGYVCWDVGHLAKYYNAYMNNMPCTDENIAKFYAPD